MKKMIIFIMSVLMMVPSFNINSIKTKANSYLLKEEFENTWKYGSGKKGNPTRMWIDTNSWQQAVTNDKEVFCVDSTKVSVQGVNNNILTPKELGYSQELMDKLALVVYFGYRTQKSTDHYFLTQNLIWELIGKKSKDQTIQHVVCDKYPTRQSQDAWQKSVLKKVEDFMEKPSFDGVIQEAKYHTTTSITDKNKVLNKLVIKKVTGGQAVIQGNTLKVTPNDDSKTLTVIFSRNVSSSQTKTNFVVNAAGDSQPVSNLTSGQDPYVVSVKFHLIQPTGYIQIRKKEANRNDDIWIGNATYQILDQNNEVVETLTTKNSSEWVKSKALVIGDYKLKELSAPDGYFIDTKTYNISLVNDQQIESKTLQDEPYGYIQIRKKSSYDDTQVANAIYKIVNSKGKEVVRLTTKNNDWVKSGPLPLDVYTISEVEAPSGYHLDTKSYQVQLTKANDTQSKTMYDEPYGYIQIRKKDANTDLNLYLQGAVYEILNEQNEVVETLTTQASDNWIKSKPLPLGTYTLKEKKAPIGYMLDTKSYLVNLTKPNLIESRTLYDMQQGMVSILKLDGDSKEPLKGVEFQISSYPDMSKPFGIKQTNEDGIATFTKLKQGNVYYIQEVKAIDGYKIDDKIHKVWIDDQHLSVSLTILNNKEEGMIKVIKLDQKSKEVLADVSYAISKNQDMSNPIEIKKTSKKGELIFEHLKYGTYYIQEIKSLDGYVIDETIHKVMINEKSHEVELTLYNKAKVTYFSKVDATTNELMANVLLRVVEKNSGNIVDQWISDGVTNHQIDKLKIGVEYLFQEVKAPNGYLKAKDIEFILKQNDETHTIVMKNHPYMEFSKIDATTSKELKGAKLQIIDKETNEIVEEWISKEQPHKVIGLISGKTYILHEDMAPLGYEIANDIEFVVGSKIKIEMKDEPYMEFSKVDATTSKELKGAKLQIIDKETNEIVEEWISKEQPHKVIGLISGKTYILHEDMAPLGYEIANDIEFVAGSKIKIEMKDELIYGSVKILKEKEDGNPLENVTFKIAKDQDMIEIIEKKQTDENGSILFEKLKYGTYYIQEEYVAGFKTNDKIYKVTINENKQVIELKIVNESIVSSFYKIDASNQKALEKVKLRLIEKDSGKVIDEWYSTLYPHYVLNLEVGKTYRFEEVQALKGYEAHEGIEFTIEDENGVHLTMENHTITKILKVDEQNRPLRNAVLKLYDLKGNLIDEWISDDKEHIIYDLSLDEMYLLKEEQAPKGYLKAKELKIRGGEVVNLKNYKTGQIELHKIDATTKERIKDYCFHFDLYNDENCSNKLLSVKTNSEGIALFKDLKYGIYYIKERKADGEYLKSNEILKVEVNKERVLIKFENEKSPKTGVSGRVYQKYIILFVLSLLTLIVMNQMKCKKNDKKVN